MKITMFEKCVPYFVHTYAKWWESMCRKRAWYGINNHCFEFVLLRHEQNNPQLNPLSFPLNANRFRHSCDCAKTKCGMCARQRPIQFASLHCCAHISIDETNYVRHFTNWWTIHADGYTVQHRRVWDCLYHHLRKSVFWALHIARMAISIYQILPMQTISKLESGAS